MSLMDKGGDSQPGGPKDPNKPAPQSFLQKCVSRLKKVLRINFSSGSSKTEKK